VRDVQRIGIFDIRLFNTDRHAGNMLVRKPRVSASASSANLLGGGGLARLDERQLELVPIDHGFCLPEALEPPYFEWLYWPQAMIPFGEEELEYIARLDGAALLELAAWELVPIDHGFALPEALEPPYFEWQHWPQAMLPFGREELDYIAALDAKADIRMLRQEVGGWVAAATGLGAGAGAVGRVIAWLAGS
jgi:hypothetical protein